jgi:hypothetical protein
VASTALLFLSVGVLFAERYGEIYVTRNYKYSECLTAKYEEKYSDVTELK